MLLRRRVARGFHPFDSRIFSPLHAARGEKLLEDIEFVMNLWYIVDKGTNFVYRLAGRAYSLAGTDVQKIAVLKTLACTDFLTASQFSLPKRFSVSNGTETMEGFCLASTLRMNASSIFEEVYVQLEKELPPQIRFIAGEAQMTPATLPKNPLCITTELMEDDDGVLTPYV